MKVVKIGLSVNINFMRIICGKFQCFLRIIFAQRDKKKSTFRSHCLFSFEKNLLLLESTKNKMLDLGSEKCRHTLHVKGKKRLLGLYKNHNLYENSEKKRKR